MKIRQLVLLFLVIFSIRAAHSQDKGNSVPLKLVLAQIEAQHDVKFSFIDTEVDLINLLPPAAALPLNEKLDYLHRKTNLNFRVTGNYITLYSSLLNNFICGYIVDDIGMPVENVTIKCPASAEVVSSDSRGYFEFSMQASGPINFNHLGYEPLVIDTEAFANDCKTIALTLMVTVMDEVITERYLTGGISKRNDGTFVIRPRRFGILPGLIEPDVLQTMQQLPGISSIDETVSNINVRGGTHDQNLFLWNGIRLFQTGHFFGLISALNPNLPHQVKIAKNGTSAFYGESVSSAVDISSQSSLIEKTTMGIGSNMINADFYTNLKLSDKAAVELSARRSFTDILDLPAYSKYSKRIFQNTVVTELSNSNDVNYKSDKEFYFYDFTGQYHQKIAQKHEAFIDFIGIKNNLDFTQGTITSTRVVTKNSSLSQLTLGGSVSFKSQWNENNKSEIVVYGSSYKVSGENEELFNNQILKQENEIIDTGLRLLYSNTLSSKFKLNTGYQYNEAGIRSVDIINTPAYSRDVKEVLHTHALIGEAEYNPENTSFFAKGGLRVNYIQEFKMVLPEPRLLLNYSLNDNWKLELLAEKKSQSVSQIIDLQQDFLGIEKRRWVLANEHDVPVQKSRQASLGVYYREKQWLISLENFYKKVEGITTPGQAFQNQLEFEKITGSYTVVGAEFLVQKQFDGFYTWLSYSWNNNEYTFNGYTPDRFTSNFQIIHTLNCAASYEWKNLKLALGSKWYTGRPETVPLSSEPVFSGLGSREISYSLPNSNNIENFFQVNFSASYLCKLGNRARLQLGLSIMNLFNRQNIINRYYRINNTTNAIERVNTYSIERTPNAIIRLSI